ncbi:MAG: hypothetical protein IJY89_04090 [Clostridia bacterium]|nr:hypothetical protein [Clostridia bacterium]
MNYLIEFFSKTGTNSIELVVIGAYIGLIIANIVAIYDKRVLGGFVRTLIAMGATSPEKAVTLYEAGYAGKRSIRKGLRGNGIFKGIVYDASENVEFDRPDHAVPIYRGSFEKETARFYIPEALKYKAEVRFEKQGTHIVTLVLGAIFFAVLLVLFLLYKDQLYSLLQQYVEMVFGEGTKIVFIL